MRGLLALALLAPLFAGCADQLPTQAPVVVEAFTATYLMPSRGKHDPYTATLTFGDVVDYVGADGRVHRGYAVRVDHGSEPSWRCRDESILGPDLSHQRRLSGNAWNDDGCVGEDARWVAAGAALNPAFGIGLAVARPPEAKRIPGGIEAHNMTFLFDGTLAPSSFGWETSQGPWYATRLSYHPRGPLVHIEDVSLSPLTTVPVTEALLPGSEAPFPGFEVSLASAVAYLRDSLDAASDLLDSGACLTGFAWRPTASSSLPSSVVQLTQESIEAMLHIGLGTENDAAGFRIEYGRRAFSLDHTFLSAARTENSWPGTMLDCKARPPVATIDDVLDLLGRASKGPVVDVWGSWYQDSRHRRTPELYVYTYPLEGQWVVDATVGLLHWWHGPRDTRIDP